MHNPGRNPVFRFLILHILLLNAIQVDFCYSQAVNYREIFGLAWKDAEDFLAGNESWMKPVLSKYDIPYLEAAAIVFPELVRYSALRDKMETTMLKTLYRNLGEDYADFSIGRFQIKPSFAEKIHLAASDSAPRKIRMLFLSKNDFARINDYRNYVIDEIENPETAINYIIAFYILSIKRFSMQRVSAEQRIIFLSTLYNAGFWKTREEIDLITDKKFYSTGLMGGEKYSYSDISLYWFVNSDK